MEVEGFKGGGIGIGFVRGMGLLRWIELTSVRKGGCACTCNIACIYIVHRSLLVFVS